MKIAILVIAVLAVGGCAGAAKPSAEGLSGRGETLDGMQTMSCNIHRSQQTPDGDVIEKNFKEFYSQPLLRRAEWLGKESEVMTITISDLRAGQILTLLPRGKIANLVDYGPTPPELAEKEGHADFLAGLKTLARKKGEPLGNKVIGGTPAVGFRVADEDGATTEFWFDRGTQKKLLVVEWDKPGHWHQTMSDIVINPPLDQELFSFKIPEGYQKMEAHASLANLTEGDLIGGLQFLAENNENLFPEKMEITQEIVANYMNKPDRAVGKDKKEMTEVTSRLLSLAIRLSGFRELNKGTFRYVGVGAKLGDQASPVCWYKPKGSELYRLVRGDLSVVDTKEADLPQVGATTASQVRSGVKANAAPKKLTVAASQGLIHLAQRLIAEGADVNGQDSAGETPLYWAVYSGHLDMAKLLIEKGARVETTNRMGETVLHLAAGKGDRKMVEFLLDQGAKLEAMNSMGYTPLRLALIGGHDDTAELLKAKGAKLDTRDMRGRTLLHQAAEEGKLELAEKLIAQGAAVDAKDQFGATPLYLAAEKGQKVVAEFLIVKGALVDARTEQGGTLLHHAATYGKPVAAEFLLTHGATVDATDDGGMTPLHKAAFGGHKDLAEQLLAHGAKVDARDRQEDTPLHKAAWRGSREVAALLIDKGAVVDARDNLDSTPLHQAARMGHNEILEFLIAKGAAVDAKDKLNRTPLEVAAEDGKIETVKVLLDKGADLNARDVFGLTPLSGALKKNHQDVADLLRQHGAKE